MDEFAVYEGGDYSSPTLPIHVHSRVRVPKYGSWGMLGLTAALMAFAPPSNVSLKFYSEAL